MHGSICVRNVYAATASQCR